MAQAPDLKIHASQTTVSVRIINTTTTIGGIPLKSMVQPQIGNFTILPDIPAFSFLVEHPSGRKLLFDLGVRKDWENLAPRVAKRIKDAGWKVEVQKGVREILEEHGVKASDIEAIVWSHWHWDHQGDPSTFDSNTALIVGPGFKKNFTPGWPTKEDAPVREDSYIGRELREVSFDQDLKIGRFDALDYFGDGSFYLLNSPGHAIGHISGLARVTREPNSFIFMGGDASHHCGEFRPSVYRPLPASISPHPFPGHVGEVCPGSLFDSILRNGDASKPLYVTARPEDGSGMAYDSDATDETIGKMIEADAQDEVLLVIAHDPTLLGVVDFFPGYANEFKAKGWTEKARWLFLRDFEDEVKK